MCEAVEGDGERCRLKKDGFLSAANTMGNQTKAKMLVTKARRVQDKCRDVFVGAIAVLNGDVSSGFPWRCVFRVVQRARLRKHSQPSFELQLHTQRHPLTHMLMSGVD